MARAHNTRVHVCVGERETWCVDGWMEEEVMGLSEVLQGMQTYKERGKKSVFPGCAAMELCHESLTVNPIIFMSKSSECLNLFLL